MRSLVPRLTLAAAIAATLVGCDSRLPVGPRGSAGQTDATDQTPPTITIDAPLQGDVIYLDDSVRVVVRANDDVGLKLISVTAIGVRQLPGASTVDSVPYIPVLSSTINSLRNATVSGYLQPVPRPADPNIVRVVFKARAIDQNDNVRDARDVVVSVVTPPTVVILNPVDQENRLRAGVPTPVTVAGASNVGLGYLGYRVASEGSNWTVPFVARDSVAVSGLADTVVLNINIPANAPPGGRMVIHGFARDLGGFLDESPPITVFIRTVTSRPPVVKQVVPPRLEIQDTIQVEVDGDSVVTVGAVVSRTVGTPRDTTVRYAISSLVAGAPPHVTGPRVVPVGLNLGSTWQGKTVTIMAFATDIQGRTGFAVPQSVTAPETDSTRAQHALSTIVYGRTFSMPVTGIAGDIAVDTIRGRAFISNTQHNRLEVWSGALNAFTPNGVAVGSQPWGMALQMDGDTLLVANSGGTNISRVPIMDADPAAIRENIARRILTRNTVAFMINEYRDARTQALRIRVSAPISYSDRPQYVAQSAGGRLYFSTKPTATAPEGSLRYMDPRQPAPDSRTVYEYAEAPGVIMVFNADWATSTNYPDGDFRDDVLTVYDHRTGTMDPNRSISGAGIGTGAAVAAAVAAGGDVEWSVVDPAKLALTDTTYVAVSGNRNWVAFGEGSRRGAARVMMAFDNDPASVRPFFSPGIDVQDLMDNASEPVFGLALDFSGATIGVHGEESHFSKVDIPFHLRLQGKYNSFDVGAGIAFHPYADGNNLGNAASRLAFVASSNGQIEVVDIGYFINRGRLPIKGNFYGPLRVSAPFPGDAARGVVLKLFGLSDRGLVVIDLTQADILAGP